MSNERMADEAAPTGSDPVMDPTLARVLGVILARLVFDGWKPTDLAAWVFKVAVEIGRPSDADAQACPTCGQLVNRRDG